MENVDNFSIEESIKRLEEIAKVLENPDTSLKTSMEIYSEGVKLIKACKDHLCDVEKEMIILTGENGDR
jgi:exodeoxyribonuclease VII small subunit